MTAPLTHFERSMKSTGTTFLILSMALSFRAIATEDAWRPAKGQLMTRWAKDVSPENAHPEYPRPQMVRKEWLNLNGLWDYSVSPKDATTMPEANNGPILVPYPLESQLSGAGKRIR